MLPYFKILDEKQSQTRGSVDHNVPSKPSRRKRTNVPGVHQSVTQTSRNQQVRSERADTKSTAATNPRKNFSANFNGTYTPEDGQGAGEAKKQASRKVLFKELERYHQMSKELESNNEQLTRKHSKLRDKCSQLFAYCQDLQEENNTLRGQNVTLMEENHACRAIIEEPRVCQTCIEMEQNVSTMKSDYIALKKTYNECHEDCSMLKHVVYRLNAQLERYQEKLRLHNLAMKDAPSQRAQKVQSEEYAGSTIDAGTNGTLSEAHLGHNHTPVQWGRVNTHTLAPLLNAYQEVIAEKEEIINNYEAEMGDFTGKLKEVLKENERLHFLLGEDTECSKVLKEELEHHKSELKATKEENDLLIKKCALKQDKIEEILKCYEQKVEMLQRDYAVLHETHCKARSEVSGLKEKNKALMNVQDEFKSERQTFIPLSVHTSSVNECKRWYEELKQQYETEKSKLEATIEDLRHQLMEFNLKFADLNSEKQKLEGRLKNADKILKKADGKYLELEHNLHEVQLSRSACRKQLHKAMNFAKDLVGEQETLLKALNQRQIENKAVKRIGTDIASRMDLLRNQLKSVQKEAWQELTTVEERIQEQDSIITSMKEEHEQEIERLKTLIKEKVN